MNVLETARAGALAVNLEDRSTLEVTGPDGRTWLNAVLSCDLTRVTPELGAWGLSLTKQGKVLSDVFVVQADPSRWLVSVVAPAAETIRAHLERLLVMEDAELSLAPDWAWIAFHGAQAKDEAKLLAERFGGSWGAVDVTGLGGAVVAVALADRVRAWEALGERGAHLCLDPSAWTALRLSRGVPEYGKDYNSNHTPHEASLDHRAVTWSKGCYLGQEVVCMQDMRGKVRRRLAPLNLGDAAILPEPGAPVLATSEGTNEEVVGEITSVSSASHLPLVAMARLKTAYSVPGSVVRVGAIPASVVTVD